MKIIKNIALGVVVVIGVTFGLAKAKDANGKILPKWTAV